MTTAALETFAADIQIPQLPAFIGDYDGPLPSDVDAFKAMAELISEARCTIQPEYRRRPADCAILMLRAKALRIELGVAIDNIYINQRGKSGQSAQLIAYLLRRAGIDWTEQESPTHVEMDFFRVEQVMTRTGRIQNRRRKFGKVRYDLHEAAAVKLSGGRTLADTYHWRTFPIPCMWARCIARAARKYFTGITLGSYTVEEISLRGVATDPDHVSDDADRPINPDVYELVEQARSESATPDLIMSDIMPRATKAQLLEADAGDGLTLQATLVKIWDVKVRHRNDQRRAVPADLAMAVAGYRPPAARPPDHPNPDAWRTLPVGEGELPCGCPASIMLAGGQHRKGVCTGAGVHAG